MPSRFRPSSTEPVNRAGTDRVLALLLYAAAALAAAVVAANAVAGIAFDSDHMGDTLFILGAGWRVHEGLRPALDFGHFYGGTVACGLAATMRLFGATVFAFDYFLLAVFALLSALGVVMLRGRLSAPGLAATILIVATLLFTRYPLEVSQSVTRLVSTHSFLYNRLALAMLLISGLFAALSSPQRGREVLGGLLAGGLVVATVLAKPTFIVLAPAVLVALLVQARWLAAAGLIAGAALAAGLFDPGGARWLASMDYAMAHVGDRDDAGLRPLLRKAVQIPLAQPVVLTFALAAMGYVLWRKPREMGAVLAALIVAAAGVGMAATMGGGGSLGQLAVPIGCMLALAMAELARRAGRAHAGCLQAVALLLVAAFALPHLANLLGVTAEGISRRGQVLVHTGPFTGYLSLPGDTAGTGRATQYEMFADGIDTLTAIEGAAERGIVSDSGVTFEFALGAPPVAGYPLWQRPEAPELAPGRPLPDDIDLVLLGRAPNGTPEIAGPLRAKMGDAFRLCARSAYWDVFARQSTAPATCPIPAG
ncbi:hypothetical protein [Tropicimonas sp.]|uniref:hypothetical protein n=1 Tax=Tropicimonas sp. TaxID=2067044 RepID=UPI003A88EBCE